MTGGTANLASLISDHFGTPLSEVRLDIALGRIEIDGEEHTGTSRFNFPVEVLKGKRIQVISDRRTYTFDYDEVA